MLAFLRFILITFLVLTILGFVFRLLLRLYLLRLARKIRKQEEEYNKGQQVGDSFIKNTTTKEKVVDNNIGDYIDYEEIDSK